MWWESLRTIIEQFMNKLTISSEASFNPEEEKTGLSSTGLGTSKIVTDNNLITEIYSSSDQQINKKFK